MTSHIITMLMRLAEEDFKDSEILTIRDIGHKIEQKKKKKIWSYRKLARAVYKLDYIYVPLDSGKKMDERRYKVYKPKSGNLKIDF